ncbi:MAG: glucose-6-phosphate dehydrogenase assembly protein OpcA [Chloroflexota bacterium]|nr:glucose-6-phosphate dehydrogenase assembly protein OpcA [Chloroflexota bacterium]
MSERERDAIEEQTVHRHLMRFGEAESLATPMWEQRGTTVSSIAAQLAMLWDPPVNRSEEGEAQVTEKGLPHARTSVLNLIVTVAHHEAAGRVVRTMMGLGVRHPSRAIVLVPAQATDGDPLDARISTHCHDTPGDERERICYEEVVLTVRGEAATHLAGVVAPLLIHDLPTFVWWPGDPPLVNPIFDQLVEMGDRLIVDSSDFSDLLTGLRRLSNLRRRSGVGDLAWGRLAWWQELSAQFFDAPRFRRFLPNLSRLHVRYAVSAASEPSPDDQDVAPGCAQPLVQALLYAGWIATRLGWRRARTVEPLSGGRLRLLLEGRYEMVDLLIEPVETDEVRKGELTSVRLRAYGEAGAAEFIIDRSGDEATVATNADGMTAMLRRVTMDVPSEPELIAAQLTMDLVDPVYQDALRAAAILLASAREAAA